MLTSIPCIITIKVKGLIYFYELALKLWTRDIFITLSSFSRAKSTGGGREGREKHPHPHLEKNLDSVKKIHKVSLLVYFKHKITRMQNLKENSSCNVNTR